MNKVAYIFLPAGAVFGASAGGSQTPGIRQSPYIDSAQDILANIENMGIDGAIQSFGVSVQSPGNLSRPLDFAAHELSQISGASLELRELKSLQADKSFRSFCSFIEAHPYRELLRIRVVLKDHLSGNEFISNIARILPPKISYFIRIV